MDRSLRSIIDTIRNFFTSGDQPKRTFETDRKRRAQPLDIPIRSKISRFAPYQTSPPRTRIIPIEIEIDDTNSYLPRRSEGVKTSQFRISPRVPMRPLKQEEVVVVDDDDDVVEIRKNNLFTQEDFKNSLKKLTSTPANSTRSPPKNGVENGDNDVILVNTMKLPRQYQTPPRAPKEGQFEKSLFNIGIGGRQAGLRPRNNLKHQARATSPGLDYSFRLDDKMKYTKLLKETRDSSIYYTPEGTIFKNYDISNSFDKTKSSLNKSQEKPKESTRETIMKVLNNMETEVIKDSDSEDSVVFITPPSPKPDIKVDRVNSLKKIVDTSEVTKRDWLSRIVESHKQSVNERQREIDNIQQCSKISEEANRDINIELLRRKVNDCLQIKELILPEIESDLETELPELTDEQVRMVQRAFRGDPSEVLARKFNLNVTRRDLMTLAGLNWLNDEVINFYMNLIMERAKDEKWPNTYAFNTFFYMKLTKDGPQSLRRWTRKVDLFSYDLICVPIHLGMHWCMAIIDFRDRSIRYYDSMGSPNNRCLEALRNYLEAEHLDKKGTSYDTSDFQLINVDDIPQQMNGSDCGMFACTFAEFISRNAKITFKQEDMPYLRKKMVVEIISGELLIK